MTGGDTIYSGPRTLVNGWWHYDACLVARHRERISEFDPFPWCTCYGGAVKDGRAA